MQTFGGSDKSGLANVMNMHTFPVCSVNLVGAVVVLLHRELVKVISEVIGGARVHVPPWINIVGRSLAGMTLSGSSSNLTIHVATIIVVTKVICLESLEAA